MAQVQKRAPSSDSHEDTAAQAPDLALQLRKMAELLRPCVKSSFTSAPPPPEPGRQHGLRPVTLGSRALTAKNAPKHFAASTRRRVVLLCLTCLINSPTRRCPKSSRMQPKLRCSSRRSPCFLLLGRSCRRCRGRLLGALGRLQKCRQRLQHVPATAAAQPQDLLENLNAEEPGSPTPSIPWT